MEITTTNSTLTKQIRQRLAKKTLVFYNIYYFFYFFGVGSFLPLYAIYLKKELLLSNGDIGTILSIFPLVSIIFQPIWGIINDKYNIASKIILLGLVMLGLSESLIFLFNHLIDPLNHYSFFRYIQSQNGLKVSIMFFTFLFGLFNSAISPLQDGLSVMFTKKYDFRFGSIRVWGSIGWATATFVSGLMVSQFGYKVIVILSLSAYTIAFLLFRRLKKFKPKKQKHTSRFGNIGSIFKNKVFITFLIFAAMSFGVIASSGGFYMLRLEEVNATTSEIGFINTLIVVVEISTMFLLLRLKNLFKDYTLLIIAIMTQIPAFLILIFFSDLWLLIVVAILRGIYQGLFIPLIVNYLASILSPDELGTGILVNSALAIGLTSWSFTLLGGYYSEWYSLQSLFTLYLIIILASLFIGFILPYLKARAAKREKQQF